MYVFSFSQARVVEFSNPRMFEHRVLRWLTHREGENGYLLRALAALVDSTTRPNAHMLALQDAEAVLGVSLYYPANGGLMTSWATPDQVEILANHIVQSGWNVGTVHGPAHVCHHLAEALATRSGRQFRVGRSERIYQIAHVDYLPSQQGRLVVATPADRRLVLAWVSEFVREAQYEGNGQTCEQITDMLVNYRMLYLWNCPGSVAMAAWVGPNYQGTCINFVYTPPEFRGKGHAKAVTAALAAHMLAGGLKFCFIFTDSDDRLTNHIYQSLGARTLCEMMRCTLHPAASPAVRPPLNVDTRGLCVS